MTVTLGKMRAGVELLLNQTLFLYQAKLSASPLLLSTAQVRLTASPSRTSGEGEIQTLVAAVEGGGSNAWGGLEVSWGA